MRTGKALPKGSRYSAKTAKGTQSLDMNGSFIFFGEKMDRIRGLVDRVASANVTVLICGESGVGKEIVARALHLNSPRRDKPLIKVNCAALPEKLLEHGKWSKKGAR